MHSRFQSISPIILLLLVLFLGPNIQAQHFQITYSIEVSGQYAKYVKNMLPNQMHLMVSPKRTLSYLTGGVANEMKMISNIETGEAILLRYSEKKYSKIPNSTKKDSIVWKKMPETKKIAGFSCQRYQIFIEQDALGSSKQDIWLTQDLQIKLGKARTQINFPVQNGFPVQMSLDMGMYVLKYTLVEWNKNINQESIFEIPEGFTEEIFNPNKIGRDVLIK